MARLATASRAGTKDRSPIIEDNQMIQKIKRQLSAMEKEIQKSKSDGSASISRKNESGV